MVFDGWSSNAAGPLGVVMPSAWERLSLRPTRLLPNCRARLNGCKRAVFERSVTVHLAPPTFQLTP